MPRPLAKPWLCVFASQTGGHARAFFATKDQARRFAERHAHAFVPVGTPLTWTDTDDSSVLSIQLGEYLVTRIKQGSM
jgi:hypothetical protein